jgi:hypothetical protein
MTQEEIAPVRVMSRVSLYLNAYAITSTTPVPETYMAGNIKMAKSEVTIANTVGSLPDQKRVGNTALQPKYNEPEDRRYTCQCMRISGEEKQWSSGRTKGELAGELKSGSRNRHG